MRSFSCAILALFLHVGTAHAGAPVTVPPNAISSGDLDGSTRWQWRHDGGTPGSSVGSSKYPVSGLSTDNAAREFYVSYSHYGGEIYHTSFATDPTATHFVYDSFVYLASPSQVANIEMDMNQVIPDGRTVIYGVQCSSYSRTWEYTTVSNGGPHWHASNIACSPKTWTANTWHHVQIASHRDDSGVVTYDSVTLDGTYNSFQNASGTSALALGWAAGDLLLNFQLDGASGNSGSMKVYLDGLTIYRW